MRGQDPAKLWKDIKGWQAKASTDPAQIARWWTDWPEARVGLLTGQRNGVTVLDVDVKNGKGGIAALFDLGFPDLKALTPVRVRTPSGGWHLLFAYEPRIKNWAGKLGVSLDVRTERGLVIAPSSWKDGKRYQPDGEPLGSVALPAFPESLAPKPEPESDQPVEPIGEATPSQCAWALKHLEEIAEELVDTPEGMPAGLWAGRSALRPPPTLFWMLWNRQFMPAGRGRRMA